MPRSAIRDRLRAAAVTAVAALSLGACSDGDAAVPTSDTGASGAVPSSTAPSSAVPSSTVPSSTVPSSTVPPVTGPVPGAVWETVDPAAAGFDPVELEAWAAGAGEAGADCVLVSRGGRIVGEWYWNGSTPATTQEVFSASKSVTSVLVGIAASDGDLSIDQPASTWLTEWRGTPSDAVTVRDLLSNDSGRHYDAATDYGAMAARAPDKTAFSLALGQDAPPSTVWQYNNSAIQTLEEVVARATGTDFAELAEQRLFAPIGMRDSSIRRDAAGNPLAFMGVQSNCRDLARFGTLVLRDGNWDGTQVVPASWVEESTGAPSQDLNAAYGLLWWLNRPGTVAGAGQAAGGADAPPADGPSQLVPGAPEDMVWALGLGNQVVQVDPGSDTVVVRLGSANRSGRFGPARTAEVVTQLLAGR